MDIETLKVFRLLVIVVVVFFSLSIVFTPNTYINTQIYAYTHIFSIEIWGWYCSPKSNEMLLLKFDERITSSFSYVYRIKCSFKCFSYRIDVHLDLYTLSLLSILLRYIYYLLWFSIHHFHQHTYTLFNISYEELANSFSIRWRRNSNHNY